MTPIDVPTALRRARRGVWLARLVRFGLFLGGFAGMALLLRAPTFPIGTGLLFATITAGMASASKSARTQHGLMQAEALLDSGDAAEADRRLGVVLRRVSFIRAHWSIALRLLALARAKQGMSVDARQLAAEALRPRQSKADADALRLVLAAAALDASDLPSAHAALSALTPPLSLTDSLQVLELQTDYCVRVGAWPHATADLPQKVELAELMPADTAASVQAMLALACRRLGHVAWAEWLSRRATLLADAGDLVRTRPALAEVLPPTPAGGPRS